ncbi:hypothetical protein O0I10_002440 [Lichtheimia ornata]|uniref:Protein YOP1 n=1 Tax=Lichtheimia ornata TaxID=688661 RepID=A0AAD7VAJ8_9FUNG|nr:uncharacterized protein O0I10_002440 [Lichtheimia ornata]KAJ8661633.1 hypothetical protein O0I10_002440 [Lichtheimia ornata]
MKDDDTTTNDNLDTRLYSTSQSVQSFLDKLNRGSPINLEFLTKPIANATVCRVQAIESFYAKSRVIRFLVRKGVPPMLLFLGLSAGGVAAIRRFYKEQTYLALNLLGVVYPAWRCWQLVKEIQPEHDRQDEYKAWLTYWMLYGSMQVLDAWAKPLTQKWPNYNLYKLIILYWAQNPYSKGAAVLCQHVLQKPIYDDDEKEESDKRQQHDYYDYNNDYQSSSPPVYTIPGGATVDDCASSSSSSATSSSSFDHPPSPEEMTLTIETPHHHHQSILDGYTPTLQESDRASSHKGFSIDDDEAATPSW